MRAYELMIIFDGDLEDAAIKAQLARITEAIEADGGRIATKLDSDPWGRRRFAYRINHKWEGFYVVLEVVTPASDIESADRILRLADRSEVVRHKILRLPDAEAARRGLLGEPTSAVAE